LGGVSSLSLYKTTLPILEELFHGLAGLVQQPVRRDVGYGQVFRSVEENLEEAAIQKLARLVSGVHASTVLLEAGFVQELGALARMLDEFVEDIWFVTQPLVGQERTDLHDRFLREFFQEEFDSPQDPLASSQKRDRIPRKKIRSALAREAPPEVEGDRLAELQRTVSNTQSGYVHGASGHILEMYGGLPPKFHVAGMADTPPMEVHEYNLWNYFHRCFESMEMIAVALGSEPMTVAVTAAKEEFHRRSGRTA